MAAGPGGKVKVTKHELTEIVENFDLYDEDLETAAKKAIPFLGQPFNQTGSKFI